MHSARGSRPRIDRIISPGCCLDCGLLLRRRVEFLLRSWCWANPSLSLASSWTRTSSGGSVLGTYADLQDAATSHQAAQLCSGGLQTFAWVSCGGVCVCSPRRRWATTGAPVRRSLPGTRQAAQVFQAADGRPGGGHLHRPTQAASWTIAGDPSCAAPARSTSLAAIVFLGVNAGGGSCSGS
jgi:hypothetical protein